MVIYLLSKDSDLKSSFSEKKNLNKNILGQDFDFQKKTNKELIRVKVEQKIRE